LENKARYTIVGLFLLIFSIAMVMFILWQARHSFEEQTKYQYRLYSTNSVAGLKTNSFVEYKGLTIGTIEAIDINPDNTEQIEVILEITNPKVIKADSYATIASQGITGNKHIEIDGGTDESPALIPEKGTFKIIPLKESFLDTLTNEAGDITKNLNKTLTNINLLLNPTNLQKINDTLNNIENGTKYLEPTFVKLNETMEEIRVLFSTNAPKTLNGIDQFTNEWTELSKQIQGLIDNDVKKLLSQTQNTLKGTNGIEDVFNNINTTLDNINTTLDTFNENGGDMIFKTRDVRYGPKENFNE